MPSHWLVIEPLLTRSDHNQLTSNQQTGNLLPGIALDLSLKVVAAAGLRMNLRQRGSAGVKQFGRLEAGLDTMDDGRA